MLACTNLFGRDPKVLEAHVLGLLDDAKSPLSVDKCEWIPETSAARCTLIGAEADAKRFVTSIRDKPISGRIPGAYCQDKGYLSGFSVAPGTLPASEEGVQVRSVFRHLGRVCLDLERR